MKIITILLEATRWILIVLFTYTAVSKLAGRYLFLQQLSKVPLLQNVAEVIAIAVPFAELVAAVSLLFIKTDLAGWWISAILMSSFSIYIAGMMLFAPQLPCSCGGIIAALSWRQHLIINVLLSSLCCFKLYRHYAASKLSINTRE